MDFCKAERFDSPDFLGREIGGPWIVLRFVMCSGKRDMGILGLFATKYIMWRCCVAWLIQFFVVASGWETILVSNEAFILLLSYLLLF
jgi:hypothetical protein